MALRDRRGPLTALVLAAAYALLALDGVLGLAQIAGAVSYLPLTEAQHAFLKIGLLGLAWRAGLKFLLVGHEYGWPEGLRAMLRIPVANVIAIMAGRRAIASYVRSLAGEPVRWDKTEHLAHPAAKRAAGASA